MKRAISSLVSASLCMCALVVLLLSAAPAKAGDGAVVTDDYFFFVISDPAFGGYSGPCTVVETPSGNLNAECTGDLLFGDPVPEGIHLTGGNVFFLGSGPLTCDATITPSGNANVSCHDHE